MDLHNRLGRRQSHLPVLIDDFQKSISKSRRHVTRNGHIEQQTLRQRSTWTIQLAGSERYLNGQGPVHISPPLLIQKCVEKMGLKNSNIRHCPLSKNAELDHLAEATPPKQSQQMFYTSAIGLFRHLVHNPCLNITFVTGCLAQPVAKPTSKQ